MVSPSVRADLSHLLPSAVRKAAGKTLICRRAHGVTEGQTTVGFIAVWQVKQVTTGRYIERVEVRPAPPGTVALGSARASASTAETKDIGKPGTTVIALSLRLGWSGMRGCSEVAQSKVVTLRADDRSCVEAQAPAQPGTPLPFALPEALQKKLKINIKPVP
ncbi:MAG: hypothetical protein H6707_07080 [Deltaproteobacteria bacterium]|nr:hypothetical protein [Deltaproteobacteria bacterium]